MILIILGFIIVFLAWGLLYYIALKRTDHFMENWENNMSKEIEKTFAESRKSMEEAYASVKSVRIEMQELLKKEGIEIPKPQPDRRLQSTSVIFDSVPLRKIPRNHEISIKVPAFCIQ